MLSSLTEVLRDFLSSLVGVTFNVASGVFAAVMGFIFSVYMLMGKEKLLRGVKSSLLAFLPKAAARKVGQVATLTNKVFFQLHPRAAAGVRDFGLPVLCGQSTYGWTTPC